MDGDVDRADVHIDDALHLVLGQVRQRDIVAEQERQTAVVILEIQAVTHTGRQLIDEAEDALVAAGALLIHQIIGELQPQFLELLLFDAHGAPVSLRRFHDQLQTRIRDEEAIIQHIVDLAPVDRQQLIARVQTGPRRGRAFVDGSDGDHALIPLPARPFRTHKQK